MSFHSTHATSHALQPMQVVTSMYLQTSSSRWTPAPGTLPEWPEMALIWSVPVAMINFFFMLAGPHPRSLSLGGPASPGFPPAPRSGRRRLLWRSGCTSSWPLQIRNHLKQLRDLNHIGKRAFDVVRVRSHEAWHVRRAFGIERELEPDFEIDRRADAVRLHGRQLRHRAPDAV